MFQFSLSEASIQPRTSRSKFERDFIHFFIRLLSERSELSHVVESRSMAFDLSVAQAQGTVTPATTASLQFTLRSVRGWNRWRTVDIAFFYPESGGVGGLEGVARQATCSKVLSLSHRRQVSQ